MHLRAHALVAAAVVAALTFTGAAFADDVAPHGEPPHGAHGENAKVEHGSGHGVPAGAHDPHAAPEHGAAHDPHAAGGHAAGGHGGHHGPKDINWTDIGNREQPAFVALVLNFGILFGAYYVLGKKPVAAALVKRREDLGREIDEAERMLKEAKQRAKKHQAALKNVETDAQTAKESLVAAGKGEVDRILREAEEKATRMKRDGATLVDQERAQVEVDLLKETVESALAKAEALLGVSVEPSDHARLTEEFLADLSRMPAAERAQGGAS